MSIATSPDQRAVADTVTEWAQARNTCDLVRSDLDSGGASWREIFGQLGDLGVFLAAVPESCGGGDGTFADVAVMLEACGASLVPGPLAATVAAACTAAAQGADIAEQLLSGERPVVTPAARETLKVVDGAVDLGPVPAWVDDALIAARLDFGDDSPRWWLIDATSVTADATAMPGPLDGTAVPWRVRLSGVEDARLTELIDDEVFTAVRTLGIAAYQAGVARHVLDVAADYAKVRTQFGKPIGSFQAVKQICADMLCRSEQLTAAAWDLARALDDRTGGDPRDQIRVSALAAEILVADLAPVTAQDAIQVLGGIGFTFEHDAHLYLRSASAARMLLGQGSDQRAELARLGRAGARREFSLDLADVVDQRPALAATADRIAAAPDSERRALLASTGFLAPHWPEPYGLGAGPALQLLIDAELDRVGVTRPDLVIAGWALPTIIEHGTEAQREKFVAPTLAGDIRWCQLFSEPEAGSDLASLRTRAARVDGGWRLSGQKIWTSEAHLAQWAVCLARTDPDAPKHKGITYFLVDMAAAGLDIRPLRELTGRAMFNEVFLDDVFVPDEMVVGPVNGGWRLARTTLANERVAMGGSGLGKEVDALLRQIDGVELTDEQTRTLGRIVADAHIGRVLDARSVVQRLSGTDPGATSSVRKLIGVVHRQSVPEFATDLLGVEALASTPASELLLLNRCLSIAGGTTQILKNAAAERILGLPRG